MKTMRRRAFIKSASLAGSGGLLAPLFFRSRLLGGESANRKHPGTLARNTPVATQTGNQGSGSSNFRRSLELVRSGVLGSVANIHIWHPPHGWPCGMDRPGSADPVPNGFNWDFWIGPAPQLPVPNRSPGPSASL